MRKYDMVFVDKFGDLWLKSYFGFFDGWQYVRDGEMPRWEISGNKEFDFEYLGVL